MRRGKAPNTRACRHQGPEPEGRNISSRGAVAGRGGHCPLRGCWHSPSALFCEAPCGSGLTAHPSKVASRRLESDRGLHYTGSWQSGRLQPPYKRSTAQPFAGSIPALPASSFSPTGSWNYPQGASSGRSQRTGFAPTVILTQVARKGKGQDDVSLVSGRLREGRPVRSEAGSALSL